MFFLCEKTTAADSNRLNDNNHTESTLKQNAKSAGKEHAAVIAPRDTNLELIKTIKKTIMQIPAAGG